MSEIKVRIFDYVIKGYSNQTTLDNNEEYKTVSIDDAVSSDSCGLIETIEDKIDIQSPSLIRSCDVIRSSIKKYKANDKPNKIPFIPKESTIYFELMYDGKMRTDEKFVSSDDLVKFININGAKKASPKTVNLTDIPENMKALYQKENNEFIVDRVLEIIKGEHPDVTKVESNTWIRWLAPKQSQSIVIFGDIHGSFATIVRNLLRLRKLNIIDKNGVIQEGYRIVFLGDVVDRGVYSFETLMILYLLKITNEDKLIFNRGNHEELDTNECYKLKDEFIAKLGKDAEQVYNKVNEIMLYQPSAVIVQNPLNAMEFVYLAHGGLPHDFQDGNRLPDVFIHGVAERQSFLISDEHGTGIRWNDIHGKDATEHNLRRINPRNDPSITPDNTSSYKTIKVIGKNLIDAANFIGIKMIIRGHQDSHHNSKIIEHGNDDWFSIKQYTKREGKNNVKCRGSIYTVSLSDDKMIINNDKNTPFKLVPVLTFSSCTDKDRNLTSDSYGILQFSDEELIDKCFVGGGRDYKRDFYKYNNKLMDAFLL